MSGGILAIIPNYVTTGSDIDLLTTCVESFESTVEREDVDLLVVDDGSPEEDLLRAVRGYVEGRGWKFIAKTENTGFARTVNVGLKHALDNGQHAVLINADIEFIDKGWLDVMVDTTGEDGEKAAIVGARLLYPNGLIQHAGVYFSLLHRWFDHIYKHAPGDLPEAQHKRTCPVTAALQLIRHSTLVDLGLYDEKFFMAYEDVDYCVRAWQAGKAVVYQPLVRAFHHESVFRGKPSKKLAEWQSKSWHYFCVKHADVSFAEFVPSVI